MTEIAIHGGCLCGAVTYTILPPSPKEIAKADPNTISPGGKIRGNHCHCDTCRQSCGGLFQTLAQIPIHRIDISDSKGSLTTYRVSPDAERQHCAICGTSLWIKDTGWDDPKDKGYINVSVGSMEKKDAKKWIDILYHIFMGDTVNGGVWEFEDKLPKYVVSDELTIGIKRGLTKDNGRVTMKSQIESQK